MIFIISLITIICIISLCYLFYNLTQTVIRDKILISIVTIDRDHKIINKVYNSIKNLLKLDNVNLLIVCRETDVQCINKWTKLYSNVIIKTIPHYDITNRHNVNALILKRNLARNYAINNNYDYLFFIDSDIIINKFTLHKLIKGCNYPHNCDVCFVPYTVKWLKKPAVGIINKNTESGFSIKIINNNNNSYLDSYESCAIGGMGCTLLNKRAMFIPFEYIKLQNNDQNVLGEDIGYFYNAHKEGLSVKYLKNHNIKHL